MHKPRLAGELEIGAQVFHWLPGAGQLPIPPSGPRKLHANPWSGNAPASQRHALRHIDPEGPLPTVDAAVTQQVFMPASLPAQSAALVQDTHTGASAVPLAQTLMSPGVHRLAVGQHTHGYWHVVVVQSHM
jgi:hypothetical protein